jgi:outer membrane protein assembly factor BamB
MRATRNRLTGRLQATVALTATFCSTLVAHATPAVPVLTFHNDNARSGWNARETRLTPTTVASSAFGRAWSVAVDGEVYGSPLYVPGLTIDGHVRNVVYAATENDSVYAIDADSGKILWGPKRLARALTAAQFQGSGGTKTHKGITCTPVIDLKTHTMYVAGLTQPRIKQQCKVWALDILTGTIKPGWPVTLHGSYRGCPFNAGEILQRGALLLNGKRLYISFGARYDIPDWHGWIISLDVDHPATSQRLFTTDPNVDGGGVWGVAGVATDAHGEVFAVTGNGGFDIDHGGLDLGQSVFRLDTGAGRLAFSYQPRDYYVPTNFKYLNDTDQDLGGSGPLLLPDFTGSSTPHLLVTAGKDGLVYLLNRDDLGGVGGELQKIRLYGDPNNPDLAEIRATPAYMRNPAGDLIVYVTGYDPGPTGCAGITALKVVAKPGQKAYLEKVWTLPAPLNNPDTPEISSNGKRDGIVWVIEEMNYGEGNGKLDAFDAATGRCLYPAADENADALFDSPVHFACPTVTDGHVFFGTADHVIAYGLRANASGKAANR